MLYSLIAVSAFLVMIGLFYRWAIVIFFLTFTYSELIDATNYLNHYYLVSLQAFLLIFLPANKAFSIDAWRKGKTITLVPQWTIYSLMLLVSIIYLFAGLAKLNPDWLLRAMPLAAWLPEHSDFPLIGYLFNYTETAFLFSWGGAFYDLFIVFFLLNARTRPFAYIAVLFFHLMTWYLFNIGLFPFIMIFSTLIFFSGEAHRRGLVFLTKDKGQRTKDKSSFLSLREWIAGRRIGELEQRQNLTKDKGQRIKDKDSSFLSLCKSIVGRRIGQPESRKEDKLPNLALTRTPPASLGSFAFYSLKENKILRLGLIAFFLIQLSLPFRHIFYPGNLLWTEEGYRFSWRVMLVEKSGQAFFYVKDPTTGKKIEVDNSRFLTEFQEKQMSVQPDFMVQYAHFLKQHYQKQYNIPNPEITTLSYVALNGRTSQQFIDPEINLASITDNFTPKNWILPNNVIW